MYSNEAAQVTDPINYELHNELWRLCAGRMFYVPKVGERVFYFPQGHVEQVEAYANQDGKMELPTYNLPSKILCEVVNVLLKVEANTDEVFAEITLIPEHTQDEPIWIDGYNPLGRRRFEGSFFSKTLTPSDASVHGGLSIPKRYADECFPPLDMSMEVTRQELVMKDLQGSKWQFRHLYRGKPRRHLLTTGWKEFLTAKKLIAGDTCIFMRGENGEILIGICRSMKSQKTTSTSARSDPNKHHGVLHSAFHAILARSMFTVSCYPRTSSAPLIIPLGQCMRSIENEIAIGARFWMLYETEGGLEQRFTGTVIGVEDVDPIRWPNSKWRCLKVQWDSSSEINNLPERVSPWSIELIDPAKRKQDSAPTPEKRARPDVLLSGSCNFVEKGPWWSFDGKQPERPTAVFQGPEEKGTADSEPLLQNSVHKQGSCGAQRDLEWGEVSYTMDKKFQVPKLYGACPCFSIHCFCKLVQRKLQELLLS